MTKKGKTYSWDFFEEQSQEQIEENSKQVEEKQSNQKVNKRIERNEAGLQIDKIIAFEKLQKYIYENKSGIYDEQEHLKLRKELIDMYVVQCRNYLRHHSWYGYSEAEKNDMLSFCVMNALEKGKDKTNKNYGTEYFCRFDPEKFDNVFAFWTEQQKNFLRQYLNDYYSNENIKQSVLWYEIELFDKENCRLGVTGRRAFLIEGSEE